jgi:hypothetical protein
MPDILYAIGFLMLNTVLWGALVPCEGHVIWWGGKKMNLEEVYIWAGVGLAASYLINWWCALFLVPVCGFLGGFAGMEGTDKDWRRWGVGFAIVVCAAIVQKGLSYNILTMPLGRLFFGLGHGVPSPTDPGSRIGRFWDWLTKGDKTATNILTRATVGAAYGLALIPLVIR